MSTETAIANQSTDRPVEPIAAGTPHAVALEAYDPDPLPDFDVFSIVVECSADTVKAVVQREAL